MITITRIDETTVKFSGQESVICHNRSGNEKNVSPNGKFFNLIHWWWGHIFDNEDPYNPTITNWEPPQRKVNWLNDSLLFYYDGPSTVGIYDPKTGTQITTRTIPEQARNGWIAQSEGSNWTDYPYLGVNSGPDVITYDVKNDSWGTVFRFMPQERGLPETNREIYSVPNTNLGFFGAKASRTESNQWWILNKITGDAWAPLRQRGKSHPSLSWSDTHGTVVESADSASGNIQVHQLLDGHILKELQGYRHQHSCFHYPYVVFSTLNFSNTGDSAIWLVDYSKDDISPIKVVDLPLNAPQNFSEWSRPTLYYHKDKNIVQVFWHQKSTTSSKVEVWMKVVPVETTVPTDPTCEEKLQACQIDLLNQIQENEVLRDENSEILKNFQTLDSLLNNVRGLIEDYDNEA